MANFADPKKIEEAARLRSQGVSLRQLSRITILFEAHLHLVALEASFALKKVAPYYDIETLKHFGTIGLWDACIRFNRDLNIFPLYARRRIRGQIWDEVRRESNIPRRRLKDEDKPKFDNLDDIPLPSHLPPPDEIAHLREVLREVLLKVKSLRGQERQVLEALANGDHLKDLAPVWGTAAPRVSQIKTKALKKMKALIRKADL